MKILLNKFYNLSIGKKIGFGFLISSLIFIFSISITLIKINENSQILSALLDQRIPTINSSFEIINGVHHSLAATRGWVIEATIISSEPLSSDSNWNEVPTNSIVSIDNDNHQYNTEKINI